jgi:hypothetical protein
MKLFGNEAMHIALQNDMGLIMMLFFSMEKAQIFNGIEYFNLMIRNTLTSITGISMNMVEDINMRIPQGQEFAKEKQDKCGEE